MDSQNFVVDNEKIKLMNKKSLKSMGYVQMFLLILGRYFLEEVVFPATNVKMEGKKICLGELLHFSCLF